MIVLKLQEIKETKATVRNLEFRRRKRRRRMKSGYYRFCGIPFKTNKNIFQKLYTHIELTPLPESSFYVLQLPVIISKCVSPCFISLKH